jgi:ABC-type branched-subunit amino acid transport system substrate-binding protein
MYPIMKAMAKYGIPPDKVMADLDFIDLLYSDTPRDELKGYYYASPLYEIPGATTGAESLRARFKEKYGTPLSYVPAYAYDTAAIIVAAQAKFGKITKETLIKATPYKGVTGDVQLDGNGDLIDTVTVAQINKDGQIVEVK